MKLVLDANVLIVAFAAHGLCEALFQSCLENHEIVSSSELLDEVRAKLVSKIKLPEETATAIHEFLAAHSTVVEPAEVPPDACTDKNDLFVLGTAAAGSVAFLVTGDKALLSVEVYGGIPIVNPRRFWEIQTRTQS